MIPLNPRIAAIGVAFAVMTAACSSSGSADPTGAASETTAPAASTSTTVPIPTTRATTTAPPTTVTPAPLGLMAMTGLPAQDEAVLQRPVLAAKIDNVEAARPQAGLTAADVVFEELVEGGLTRLLAIFHSRDATELGPIRSARSTDLPLLTPLREPLFAWSGANSAFASLIRSVAIRDVGFEAEPGAYRRDADRPAPSNLMTSTAALYALVDLEGDMSPNPLFDHLAPGDSPAGGRVVDAVEVDYGATTVVHEWDAELGGWARSQNGTPHVDVDGERVAPTNVVVQFVEYRDTGLVDASGAAVPEAVLEGAGPAWILRAGRLIEGSWEKANVTASSRYLDADGEVVPLVPGTTWVLLSPLDGATTR